MFDTKQIEAFFQKHGKFFNQIPMIHVAGTNGKGSTCKMLSNILSSKYQVGMYTSPYDSWRFDSIEINGKTMSHEKADTILNRFKDDFELYKLSPFEIETVVALTYFYEMKVDLAIIEVGLGGLDDATNVITPIVSVITNIGSDHQDVLGYGIANVAKKKAGIIKPHVPVVIGPDIDKIAFEIIYNEATNHHAKMYQAEPMLPIKTKPYITCLYKDTEIKLKNQALYQISNVSTVLKTLEVLNDYGYQVSMEDLKIGFFQDLLEKRFEVVWDQPKIILDGAHNLEGIQSLVETLKKMDIDNLVIITSILKDKPYVEMIDMLKSVSNHIVFTTFKHERALKSHDVNLMDVIIIEDMNEALKKVLNDEHHTYLITGSLYFLTQAKAYLKEILR